MIRVVDIASDTLYANHYNPPRDDHGTLAPGWGWRMAAARRRAWPWRGNLGTTAASFCLAEDSLFSHSRIYLYSDK